MGSNIVLFGPLRLCSAVNGVEMDLKKSVLSVLDERLCGANLDLSFKKNRFKCKNGTTAGIILELSKNGIGAKKISVLKNFSLWRIAT
jgi:hypothetical protein